MGLSELLVFLAAAFLLALLKSSRARAWGLMVVSVLVIYWLQPPSPIRHLDFWLPTAALALTVWVYYVTQQDGDRVREDALTGAVLAGIVALIALTRYLGPVCCLTPTRPPQILPVLAGLLVIGLIAVAFSRFSRPPWSNRVVVFIAGVFIVLKTPEIAETASAVLRRLTGQTVDLASPLDISWLGFSYVAFRLIHTLRDRVAGRLPQVDLQEFVTYVIFFPAYTAGPIDRLPRFVEDLRRPFSLLPDRVTKGLRRVVVGIFIKFALADSLALIALDPQNALQLQSSGWAWFVLYVYSLRIYFDFAGYTDIAIGIGTILGIDLPENFNRPYLQTNLINFWNNWHMTLTQWFRAYFFNPVTRALRTAKRPLPMWVVLLVGQFGTMLLIGLWHGITLNFVIWGWWHGLGLFVNNRWQDFTRRRGYQPAPSSARQKLASLLGGFITFNYVALGWVWFALPEPEHSLRVLKLLFGLA